MLAILKVMYLGLRRDRGAFVMAFVLPPVIFLIFASVFAGAGGGDLSIKVALHDSVDAQQTKAVVDRLRKVTAIKSTVAVAKDAVEQAVRRGRADAGLVIRLVNGTPRFVVIEDPTKKAAASVLLGHLRAALQGPQPAERRSAQAVTVKPVVPATLGDGTIAYYAGAVAILFLLFAAVQNAVTLQEDRENSILDRLVVGPYGIGALISGKFAFIVLLGIAQVAVIFILAWLIYGVALPAKILPWLATTVAAAICAAGICLFLATLCTSRRQAQTLGNFLVLIISAIGGSMVPRFLMPEWLQTVGWLTPNAWVLEAYTSTFWRGGGIGPLATAWLVLTLAGLVALAAAHRLGRRFEKL